MATSTATVPTATEASLVATGMGAAPSAGEAGDSEAGTGTGTGTGTVQATSTGTGTGTGQATSTAMGKTRVSKAGGRKARRKRRPPPAEFYAEPEPVVAGPALVVVRRSEKRLYLLKGGEVVRVFRVGVGRERGMTPAGRFHIIGKAYKPAWSYRGKFVPGGSKANPLGKWWMGLSVTHRSGTRFGIHGTNAPWSIGRNASRGCIRMHNRDAASLFSQVAAGTPVVIY